MCPRRLTTMPYKKSMLEAAVKAVIAGTFTTKQSASVYGVPAGTISTQLRRKGYSGRTKRENGSLIQVDQQVLEWLQLMSEIGCFSLKNQLGDILREVFERLGLRDKLTAKMASQTLTSKFLQRNPNLPASFIESKEIGTNLTATDIDQWVAKQREHILNSYNLVIGDFLVESNSQNVFCCFEVGSVFPSIKNRFSRLIYKPKIDGPLLLTLYCCLCADGSFLKPVAVVKTEDASQTTMENKKSEFHILYSKHGKMDCEAAMLWLQLIHEETKQRKGKNPFIIYLDQFIRPLSLATLDFCRQRELILYYLPGHYPHVKLPFGMDVFYNLNGEYDAILASDDAKHNASSTDLTLTLLVDAWKQMLATNATTTEFRDFGILPLDPTALKSIVETIVPITMSSSEGLSDNMEVGHSSKDAAAVPQTPNLENDAKVLKNTQRQVPSPHSSTSSTAKRTSRSALRSYKESSDTDEQVQLTSAEDGSLVSLPGADAETDIVSQKPNIKIKIKRSNRTPNDFCVESGPNNQNFTQFDRSLEQPVPIDRPSASSNSSMSCSHCNRERQKAVKSGVVEGLLYALKRIESSLRADTLHLYKTRYLSPYLRDHRPTEPSFLIWCEIMKCLEIGPEAVHQDYLMSRNMHEHHPFLNSHSPVPTKHSALPQTRHIPNSQINQCSGVASEQNTSEQGHQHSSNFGALPTSEVERHSGPTNLPPQVKNSSVSDVSEVRAIDKPSISMLNLNNNVASKGSTSVLYSSAGDDFRSTTKHPIESQNLPMTEDLHTRRLPDYPGMHSHFQGKPNSAQVTLAPHSADDRREMTNNSLLHGSVERELPAAECDSRSLSGSQYPPIQYSSQHTLHCEEESMHYDQYQPNFEAQAPKHSPKYHETCVKKTLYESTQNTHPQRRQQAQHSQDQNFQSQRSVFPLQQQIRFSTFPLYQQQQKQAGQLVAVRPSFQDQRAHQVPPAPEPGQLHFSRKITEDENADFPTFCTPYKQASTPKCAPMPLPGRQTRLTSSTDSSKPQGPAMALELVQNDPSAPPTAKIEQYGVQQSYDDRMAMASRSSNHSLRNSACAMKAYGIETPMIDEGNHASMTCVGSKPAVPYRSMYCTAAPATEVWSQNSVVPTAIPRSVWAYPPNDSISHRTEAFDPTSGVCSTVHQQQSVISYQNYLAATSSYTRTGVAMPVTAAEELPKTTSYTNL